MKKHLAAAPLALALLAVPSAARAQQSTGGYAILRGADSVVVERFTRTAVRLEVRMNAFQAGRLRYAETLSPNASTGRVDLAIFAPTAAAGDTTPTGRASAAFRADSVELIGIDNKKVTAAAPNGAVAYVNPSAASFEQIVRRAKAIGGATVQVPVYVLAGGGQTVNVTVTFGEAGAATVVMGPVQVDLKMDAQGAIASGTIPSQGLTIVRLP
jgi:hypothetical protein